MEEESDNNITPPIGSLIDQCFCFGILKDVLHHSRFAGTRFTSDPVKSTVSPKPLFEPERFIRPDPCESTEMGDLNFLSPGFDTGNIQTFEQSCTFFKPLIANDYALGILLLTLKFF